MLKENTNIDQKFQSIKLKYTQGQKNLDTSPLKVKVSLPKHNHYDHQLS